ALGPLLGALSGVRGEPKLPLNREESSALAELGNILCGHYLGALSDLAGLRLLHSTPSLSVDMAGALAQTFAADAALSGGMALLLENRLLDVGQGVSLYLLFVPDPDALDALFAGLARSTGVDPRGR
ncbi:MAG: chemotaxis protein CheC, partial [bacterium]